VERRVALAGFVTQMLEDPDGALWFPTWGVGLYRAGPQDSVARVFRADPSRRGALPADVIQAAIADEAGNRWFGTNGGLAFVPADAEARGSLDTAFARARDRFRNRVLDEAVSGLWLDGSGRLWVATVGGGLYLQDPGALAFERVFESDETAIRQDDSDGGSLLEDGDAGLWYLVGERLARLDLRDDRRDWIDMAPTDPSWAAIPLTTFSRVAGHRIGLGRKFGHLSTVDAHGLQVRHWPVDAPQPAPREALCGFRDREGRFWYTSYQGLYVDTEGLGHAFDTVVAGHDGRQIGQTPDGDLWFGSWNAGVLRIDGSTGERRVYHPDSADGAGLRGADAHFLAVGPDGDVFVRTSRGMNVWRETEGRWIHPPGAGAPPWHQINDLALAPDGNVWGVDQHRVYRWSPEDNRTLVLDESFGLPDAGYLDVAAPSDGLIYLSTTAGLLRFDPAAIPRPEWPPAVRLTELVLTDARGSRTHSLLGRPAPVLGYREDVIECRFAPLHFGLGGQVAYEYRLSGERGAWIPLEGQPRIVLLDQRPGRYRLEIRGRNAWDQAGPVTTLPLRIRPPWWFTRTAYGGYGLALVLGVVGYNRARLARYRRRQLVLERTVRERTRDIRTERDRSEALLLNILPADIARELKETGQAEARQHEDVSVLFTDFRGFTETAAAMDARELVEEINACFKAFDGIVERFGIEKIKTIGDAYMAAGGLGGPSAEGAHATVCAALAMQAFVRARHAERVSAGRPAFTMRVGIHTGPVVAGIVGVKKFQYDVWGDTVNVASRMESAGAEHRVNCSAHTHALLRDRADLAFEARGEVPVKGKGTLAMWFVDAAPDGGTEPGRGSRRGGLSTAGPTDGAEARQPGLAA
jgi:class 3 adenylate cyclase/sugar lactone lactonase YvrE